jgi:hypothetical protein
VIWPPFYINRFTIVNQSQIQKIRQRLFDDSVYILFHVHRNIRSLLNSDRDNVSFWTTMHLYIVYPKLKARGNKRFADVDWRDVQTHVVIIMWDEIIYYFINRKICSRENQIFCTGTLSFKMKHCLCLNSTKILYFYVCKLKNLLCKFHCNAYFKYLYCITFCL